MNLADITLDMLKVQEWKLLKDVSKSDEGVGGQSTIEVNTEKTIIKKKYKKQDKKYYMNERLILYNVSHPNIIKLVAFDDDDYTLYLPYYKLKTDFSTNRLDNLLYPRSQRFYANLVGNQKHKKIEHQS